MSSRNEGILGWGRLPAQQAALFPETKAHIQIPGKINSCWARASSLGGALASPRTPKWARDVLLTSRPPAHTCYSSSLAPPGLPGPSLSSSGSCRLLPHLPHPVLSPTCLSLSLSLPSDRFPPSPSVSLSFIHTSLKGGRKDKSLGFQIRKVMFKGHKIIKSCKCYPLS